jgi:hypothetical protein
MSRSIRDREDGRETVFKARVLLLAVSLAMMAFPILSVHAFTGASGVSVFVNPDQVSVKINQTFQVFVNVSSVLKLQGFDFMLTYDNRILNCTDLEEGTFLSSFGPTFVAKHEIKRDFTPNSGRAWLALCILGPGSANGSGILAIISFKALSVGETGLDLHSDQPLREDEVKLTTCGSQPISNKAIDGSVTVNADDSADPSNSPPNLDLNLDGVVDIVDISMVALGFGSVRGDLRFDVKADIDQNGVINILDVTLVANGSGRVT